MATLPTTKRISVEDVKDAPKWFIAPLSQINTFFSAFYDAVNGQLTFVDNINAQRREIKFTTLSDYTSDNFVQLSFPNLLRRKAEGLLLMQITEQAENYTPIREAVSLDWRDLDGEIVINHVSGLANSTTYILKVMVI